jgi:hypothetical protein
MANFAGTVTGGNPPYNPGYDHTVVGTLTLASGLANTDTITWTNILPDTPVTIRSVRLIAPELDTGATPTGTIVVGNSDDDDGYILVAGMAVGLQNSLASPLLLAGTGLLMDTKVSNRTIIATVKSAVATAASSGVIRLEVTYRAGTI